MNNRSNSSEVDNSQSLGDRDSASKARAAAGNLRRERRDKSKWLKDRYKETLRSLDNTADKRELKEQYKSAILDLDTSLESNKSGAGSTIQDDGIDNVDSSVGDGGDGGGLPDGYVETNVILCVNGGPVYGQFLFKETI
jgi:hypothetical protein